MNPVVEIFASILVPLFPQLDSRLHPWWWPHESGHRLQDWGLTDGIVRARGCDPQALHNSLQKGPWNLEPPLSEYPGFLGSVGAQPRLDLVWILSSRPSNDSFPNSNGSTTRLYNVLKGADLVDHAHVTDLVKFRGPGPDRLAHSHLELEIRVENNPANLLEVSMECLKAEFDVLPPNVVLTSGRAKRWLKEFADESVGHGVKTLLSDLRAKSKEVTSWMAYVGQSEIAQQWKLAATH